MPFICTHTDASKATVCCPGKPLLSLLRASLSSPQRISRRFAFYCPSVFAFGSSVPRHKPGSGDRPDHNPCNHAVGDTLGKFLRGTSSKQKKKRTRGARERGGKAQLIERAGLRKHLPVWKAKHLSDPFSHQVVSLFTLPLLQFPVARPLLAAWNHSFFFHVH